VNLLKCDGKDGRNCEKKLMNLLGCKRYIEFVEIAIMSITGTLRSRFEGWYLLKNVQNILLT